MQGSENTLEGTLQSLFTVIYTSDLKVGTETYYLCGHILLMTDMSNASNGQIGSQKGHNDKF